MKGTDRNSKGGVLPVTMERGFGAEARAFAAATSPTAKKPKTT